jgi:hypothetical protein
MICASYEMLGYENRWDIWDVGMGDGKDDFLLLTLHNGVAEQ